MKTKQMKGIDTRCAWEQSIIRRYRKLIMGGPRDLNLLDEVSEREGVRVFHLMDYQDVAVYILDETSLMVTGSFEDLVGCVTLAMALERDWFTIVSSSGGNLGTALAHYAAQSGVEAYSFQPTPALTYLDSSFFELDIIHLYGVEIPVLTRRCALRFARELEEVFGYSPLVPRPAWRYAAYQCLGYFLIEYMTNQEMKFSWIAQTTSAGFGPIGIYQSLRKVLANGLIERLPSFLCIQQEANCRAYEEWTGEKVKKQGKLLLPKLFDPDPNRTFRTFGELFGLLRQSNGTINTISQQEFDHYITAEVIELFSQNNVCLTLDAVGKPIHKAGLMALAGILKAIDQGVIQAGPVLCCLTEGTQPLAQPAVPERIIFPPL